MKQAGFDLTFNDVPNVGEIKAQHHVPADAQTCHTALVGGYVVEGHVPADVVKQLLKEKPAVAGLAVPGMPIGSPGMESADGNKQAYNVLSFDKAGKTQVYAVRCRPCRLGLRRRCWPPSWLQAAVSLPRRGHRPRNLEPQCPRRLLLNATRTATPCRRTRA
jgi:hypothetical protein